MSNSNRGSSPAGPGPAVDQSGRPVIDPTENVLDLVEAAVKRLDDVAHIEARRQDDLRVQADAHLGTVTDLTSKYESQLRIQESARIDAIRAVDVAAVQRASEVQAVQATTLATQVQASAEALRNQVAAAATAATTALAAALEPIQKDINDLRRAQYEQQGQKAAVVESKSSTQWVVGIIISVLFLTISVISVGIVIATHK